MTKRMRCILLISNRPDLTPTYDKESSKCKAAYLIFHPERNNVLPKLCYLSNFSWFWLNSIRDFGIIYVPPRTKRKFHKQHGQLYIIGGYDEKRKKVLRNIRRYDFKRCEWLQCCKLETRRMCFTPFLYDGKIYCAGGFTTKHHMTDTVEYYEPTMDAVYQANPLPRPAANYACVYHTKLRSAYIIGGQLQSRNGIIKVSNHLWCFSQQKKVENEVETITESWSDLQTCYLPLPDGIIGHRSVISDFGDRIYVIGGTSGNQANNSQIYGLYYINTNILRNYDPESKDPVVWNKRDISETKRSNSGIVLIENKIFVIGGTENKFNSTVSIAEVNEEEELEENQIQSTNNDSIASKNNNLLSHQHTFCPINNCVGYYDWKRKIFNQVFQFDSTKSSIKNNGIELDSLQAVIVDLDSDYEEFYEDRYDWMIQWSLW